ncbi:hypothetical protein P4H67_25815 [Paenibacillus lautus]|uniref:hypothetical protein n=1 Tax=Paenibacillus lautus TaxID=1401 RepID=UPI002DBAA0C1|nr:hypothetical protein [Paenibacillus lautus]MEC0310176.1 hypothetical protein [Paenibacillus lautus]
MAKKKEDTVADQVQTELTIGEGGQGSTSDAGAQPAQNPAGTSDGESTPEQEPQEMIRVEFLTNCTHNRDRYHAGQRESLPEGVFEILLKAKAVRRLGE